jgi:hypothetical protein
VRIDPRRPKIEAAKQLGVQPTTIIARLIASADSWRETETTIRVLEGSGTSSLAHEVPLRTSGTWVMVLRRRPLGAYRIGL